MPQGVFNNHMDIILTIFKPLTPQMVKRGHLNDSPCEYSSTPSHSMDNHPEATVNFYIPKQMNGANFSICKKQGAHLRAYFSNLWAF